jgi:hypothetical protein
MIFLPQEVNNDPPRSLFTFFNFRTYLVFKRDNMPDKGEYSFHEKLVSFITAAVLIGMVAKIIFF